ncbi:hypothetical protein HANVADRAFT_53221 [Hanseniaspora valbyensis NRRL Y-1626]|uniref:ESCRT-II complex subunit VPS36 n=1 Tax=Hanseniaspora valbyensis NRRL Y-1626 TaxID=766949 RepID=A0A1B7TCA1_9ASCO|nr:hypothetical protein HANVADRAFT_53221 [Hanseniaspora valbyensis NRRL Y-1626]
MSLYKLPKLYNNDISSSSYAFLMLPKEEHLITYNQITVAINNHKLSNPNKNNSNAGNNSSKLYGQLYLTNTRLLFLFEDINDGFYIELKDISTCINVSKKESFLWKNDVNIRKILLRLLSPQATNSNNINKAQDNGIFIIHSWDCPVCFEHNTKKNEEIDGNDDDDERELNFFICKLCGTNISDKEELINYSNRKENILALPNTGETQEGRSQVACEKCTFFNDSNELNCKICLNPLFENKVKLDTFADISVVRKDKTTPNEIKIYYTNNSNTDDEDVDDDNLCKDINDLMGRQLLLSSKESNTNINGLNDNVAKKLINNIRQERRNDIGNKQQGIRTLISDKESKMTELDILIDTSLQDINTFLDLSEEVETFFKDIGEYNNNNYYYGEKTHTSSSSFSSSFLVKRSSNDMNTCLKDKWFMKDLFKEFNDYLNETDYKISTLNDLFVEYNLSKRKTVGFISPEEFASVINEYKLVNKFNKHMISSIDGVDYLINKEEVNEYINLLLEFLVKNIDNEIDMTIVLNNIEKKEQENINNNCLPLIKCSMEKCVKRGNVLLDIDTVTNKTYYYYNYLI